MSVYIQSYIHIYTRCIVHCHGASETRKPTRDFDQERSPLLLCYTVVVVVCYFSLLLVVYIYWSSVLSRNPGAIRYQVQHMVTCVCASAFKES